MFYGELTLVDEPHCIGIVVATLHIDKGRAGENVAERTLGEFEIAEAVFALGNFAIHQVEFQVEREDAGGCSLAHIVDVDGCKTQYVATLIVAPLCKSLVGEHCRVHCQSEVHIVLVDFGYIELWCARTERKQSKDNCQQRFFHSYFIEI